MRTLLRPLLATLAGAVLAGVPLAAQAPQTPRTPQTPQTIRATQATSDSLAERLRRAEVAIESLRTQLGEPSQAKVQSRLRNQVEISGLILVNGFWNNGKTNNSDVPLHADTLLPADTLGLPNSNIGGTMRQTHLGVTISGARALGAELSGDLQLDFMGGQLSSTGGRTFPLLRIRTASFRLDWPHVGLLVGQEGPLISPRSPVSFASSGFPLFAGSGNLWQWIPQARVTWEKAGAVYFGLQGAMLAPTQARAQGLFTTQPDSAERSLRPFLEGRAYVAWGANEVGLGVHGGWIATTGDSTLQSTAVAIDVRVALGDKVSVTGEAFSGQALAALGGGGIGQDFGVAGIPLRTRGGWTQLDVRPDSTWEFGAGVGVDDPNDADMPTARGGEYLGRLRNATYTGHIIVRPGGGLLLGMEVKRIETTYGRGMLAVHHVNAFAGLAF